MKARSAAALALVFAVALAVGVWACSSKPNIDGAVATGVRMSSSIYR
jgi:hypothetical protein